MDFRRSTRRSLIKPILNDLSSTYPHELQLYNTTPNFEVSFADVEQSAIDRMAVLQTIDEISSKGLKGDDWRRAIVDELKKQGLKGFCKLVTSTSSGDDETDLLLRKRDHISRYILRLAYCTSEDKRRWFVAREVDLFRLRWMYLAPTSRTKFLKLNNLKYDIVSDSEKEEFIKWSNGMIQLSGEYFKVPFQLVSELLRNRKVFLHKGIAFINNEDIISVITNSFRSSLAQYLAFASRRIHNLCEDTRIQAIVNGSGKVQREIDYTAFTNKEKIDIRNIDAISELSFPLCMKQLHDRLRNDHHLRHSARQQYGLFLKGIGVTLEDALKFWRSEFTKKMDIEKFEKSYSYNIRHNYGKEGKRANYAPQSCMKIINGSVGPGEFHGCPFRHSDTVSLKRTLEKNNINSIAAQEILDLAKKGHYQLACSAYFQRKHNVDSVTINHPNVYFDESQMILVNKCIKKEFKNESENKTFIAKDQKQENMWDDDMEIDFSAIES
uniref:DNA primase large subunit n=2 Tax=Rhodnius prolixus TaxID=13249 RepID=A0A4P6DF33_RHOPR